MAAFKRFDDHRNSSVSATSAWPCRSDRRPRRNEKRREKRRREDAAGDGHESDRCRVCVCEDGNEDGPVIEPKQAEKKEGAAKEWKKMRRVWVAFE